MSTDTKAALEAAIEAHVADECEGDLAGAWVLLAETTTLQNLDDEDSVFYLDFRQSQSRFLTDGLLHAALNRD